jgi:hypothetical protein
VRIGEIEPGDLFVFENRVYRCSSTAVDKKWVFIETTAGTLIHEHADVFVELKEKGK